MVSKAITLVVAQLVGFSAANIEDFLHLDVAKVLEQPYSVLQIYRRTDPSFIQGLYFDLDKRQLLESTGLYRESKTQWLNIDEENGVVSPSDIVVPYKSNEFGEGISLLDDQTWIELTWKERTVNLLDRDSLETRSSFEMWKGVKEGWGITLDPKKRILYVSDGSATITRVDADSLQQLSQFTVKTKNGRSQRLINELEFVDGYIWANVFYLNGMVKIDPDSGYIVEEVDFTPLQEAEMGLVKDLNQIRGYDYGNNVCNGIAYDPVDDVYFVTGKRWNMMFKIRLDKPSIAQ